MSQRNQYLAPDILDQGAEVFEGKIHEFNSAYVMPMCKHGRPRHAVELGGVSSPPDDEETTATVLEMEPSALVVEERTDCLSGNLMMVVTPNLDGGNDNISDIAGYSPMED